jgi:hypothetical protein
MQEFKLIDDDFFVIATAENVASRLLNHPMVTPEQAIGVKNALHALKRLPLVTPDIYCEFGISYRAGTEDFSELRYIDFTISDSMFQVSNGGSVYDSAVGSDSFSDPDFLIEIGGYRSMNYCEYIYDLEASVSEYLNLGAKISVSDGL